jgi:GINS complex subunit 3
LSTISNHAAATDSEDTPITKIEMPLWLGIPLAENGMVEIEIPKHFGARMRNEMSAGAAAVNLREYSHYFFDVGLRLSRVTRDNDLQRILRSAFCGDRFKALLVRCLSR